ncbi:hypothetical protein PMN64_42850, partial [Bradyrhizobium sp. UFLA01-814]
MKRFLLSVAAIVGMATPALSADMAVKAAPVPVPPPVYNWTGFYIGANGGWGESRTCWDFLPALGGVVADGCSSRSGGVFGGQLGYRWQAGQFVFGLEGQGDWADLKSSRLSLIDPRFSTTTKTDGLGLFT